MVWRRAPWRRNTLNLYKYKSQLRENSSSPFPTVQAATPPSHSDELDWRRSGSCQGAVAFWVRGESTASRASGYQWDASNWQVQNLCTARLFNRYTRLPVKILKSTCYHNLLEGVLWLLLASLSVLYSMQALGAGQRINSNPKG